MIPLGTLSQQFISYYIVSDYVSLSFSIVPTVANEVVLFHDTFTDTNGVLLDDHIAEVPLPWSYRSGVEPEIRNNKMDSLGTVNQLFDVGTNNFQIDYVGNNAGGQQAQGPRFRKNSDDSGGYLLWFDDNTTFLYGASGNPSYSSSNSSGMLQTVRIICDGTSVKVWVNGVLRFDITEATEITGTYCGNRFYNNAYVHEMQVKAFDVAGQGSYVRTNIQSTHSDHDTLSLTTFDSTVLHIREYKVLEFTEFATSVGAPLPVVDGLIVHLDAHNAASYPGTGTVWTDLSGNEHHATILGTNHYITSPGRFDFRAVSNITDWVQLPHTALQALSGDYTLIFWMQPEYAQTGRYFHSVHANSDNNWQIMSLNNGAVASYLGGSTVTYSDDEFFQLALTRSGTTGTMYKNTAGGVLATLSDLSLVDNGGWALNQEQDSIGGGFDANQCAHAAFISVILYDRALSTAEIAGTYTSLKVRYGLA